MPNSEKLEEFLKDLKDRQHVMSNSQYYDAMAELARLKRLDYKIGYPTITLSLMRQIYKIEGIRIDKARKRLKKVRAAYFCQDGDYSVLISPHLPDEPRLFSLAHELKHHFVDQEMLTIPCVDVTESSDRIEIGAEVFAAEFILPMSEFKRYLLTLGIRSGSCSPNDVCRLKREFKIPMSYQSICKRLYIFGIIPWGSFDKIKFTKLNEEIYGVPFYKVLRGAQKRAKETSRGLRDHRVH